MTTTPVTLLTGFLGSGKSTLLTQVLRDPRFSDTAVVVNEFGEVGLDGFLVEHGSEQLVEMTTGCLCCTIRGDIRQTLLDLDARRARGAVPAFSRLIVETTGLADPAPVLHTLIKDPRVARCYGLAGIVTTVDAVNGERTLEAYEESVKQVAVADRLVLTKTDLAKDPASRRELAELTAVLRRINPGADVLDRQDAAFDHRRLFDTAPFDPAGRSADVQRWLNEEAFAAVADHKGGHGHGHHHHDVNRHGTDIQAYSLILDRPIGGMAFRAALDMLIAGQGADLLRVKGIVHLREDPERPVVIHGVQHVFHEPIRLAAWPSADRRTRLVFITRGIPRDSIETLFRVWQDAEEGSLAEAAGSDGRPHPFEG